MYYTEAEAAQALRKAGVIEPHAGWIAECAARIPEGRLDDFARAFAASRDIEVALETAMESDQGHYLMVQGSSSQVAP